MLKQSAEEAGTPQHQIKANMDSLACMIEYAEEQVCVCARSGC
jgi:hypothetical protein